MTLARRVRPLDRPPDVRVPIPGSKSLTNRALVCAALARGSSVLDGVLVADDTEAMSSCLLRLGIVLRFDRAARRIVVDGSAGQLGTGPVELDARQSGTTSRFLLPVLALGAGPYRLDGEAQLRRRPMGELIEAVRQLGAMVIDEGEPSHLPVTVRAPARQPELVRSRLAVPGDITSQFLSALMLSAPCFGEGVDIDVGGPVVSAPYLAMTAVVMEAFGAQVRLEPATGGGLVITIDGTGYRATGYAIEPDASAASYFLAAAAITGGRVRIDGLGDASPQGDARFVDVLERMGATVERGAEHLTVQGTGVLHGLDVDLVDMPDMATTLAAVAVFADAPTRVRGVQIIRGHETDRIAASVNELRRAGIDAVEHDDGFTVHPGSPRPTRFHSYDDHRMAMSFALLGLRVEGIEIADAGCVAKTFPDYFEVLDLLRGE